MNLWKKKIMVNCYYSISGMKIMGVFQQKSFCKYFRIKTPKYMVVSKASNFFCK